MGKAAVDGSDYKQISKNRKAYHDYEVIKDYEVGIELTGTEVKALRAGKVNLSDGHAMVKNGEVFLHNVHIGQYDNGNIFNHTPLRVRKLLLHKKEILYLFQQTNKQPLTLIPLSIYFKKQWVKVKLGLCRGRKNYDKRRKLQDADNKRRLANLMKNR